MRRTLTRALVAAGAVLALTGGPLLMAAAAQASVTRPASNLPWCDETGWCIAYQDEYTVGIVAVPYIGSINGLRPDGNGNFTFTGLSTFTVDKVPGSVPPVLRITNVGEPCCECPDYISGSRSD